MVLDIGVEGDCGRRRNLFVWEYELLEQVLFSNISLQDNVKDTLI